MATNYYHTTIDAYLPVGFRRGCDLRRYELPDTDETAWARDYRTARTR
jgi:hypothetical protein